MAANTRLAEQAVAAALDVTTDFRPGRARVGAVGRHDPRRHRLAPAALARVVRP